MAISQGSKIVATDIKKYTATIGTTWTANGSYYTQTISLNGILATDTPIIGPVQSSTTDLSILNAWNNIYRIDTAANQLIVYSYVANTTAVPIQLQVIR